MTTTETATKTEELVKDYHGDLLAYMEAYFKAASQDEEKVPRDSAGFLMTRIRVLLGDSLEALRAAGEERFGDLDFSHQVKETLAKATGWTLGSLSGIGDHSRAKMLRDQYMFLNGVSVGYSMLYTCEVGAHGGSDYADELLKHLREWNQLVVDFNRTLPAEVLRSLAEEEEGVDQESAVRITEKLQATWSSSDGDS